MAKDLLNHTELTRRFKTVDAVVEHWNTSSTSTVEYRGAQRKAISADCFEVLEKLACMGAEANDRFHEGAYKLALAITAFAKAWFSWVDRTQAGEDTNPAGDGPLWATYEQVRAACEATRYPLPEPISQLIKQDKVEAWQVAKMYGWKDEPGLSAVMKVQEELENPGKHYNPKNWVHPAKAIEDKELAEKWSARVPVEVPVTLENIEQQIAESAVAPESLDTLIQQRVPIEQICKMKQVDQETVERRASELGVVLADARHIYPASPRVAIEEELARNEKNQAEYEADMKAKAAERKEAISKRIKELNAAGKSKDEVTAIISAEFPS